MIKLGSSAYQEEDGMNEVWNLDNIYHGFEDPAFEADMQALQKLVADMDVFAQKLPEMDSMEGLKAGLSMQEQFSLLVEKLAGYASLRQAANTTDSDAGSAMGRIMGIYSGAAGALAAFESWASQLPDLQTCIASDQMLSDYRFLLENLKDSSRYLLPGVGEAVMAKMSLSGGSAWGEMQQYLTATVKVDYRGETLNLPGVRNLAYSEDAQVRKDAYEAELACYKKIAEPVAFALNSIKLETISDCQLRGYASPLERTLKHSHMEKATLDAMFAAIDEYLPKFHLYLKTKAKALGHEGGLPWYDLFAPMGKTSSSFTVPQARDYLMVIFSKFDSQLADMVDRAFRDAWIDFYPRAGKTGGAFCAGVPSLGESRILTNFGGTFSDVVVLAHELGHAFHDQCILDRRPLNHDYSMPVAETASTFNECVVMNRAIADAADREEKLALLESQLRDVTQIICDIYSRYLFETAVFANRESRFMNADTLCEMMLDAQKRAYGDGLDQNMLHPYMWVCKSHYYGPTFYNFPYAFGGLFARGLYARYEAEGASFVPKYKELLHTTPVATAEDTAKVCGIDLTDKDFWRGALQTVADKIDLFCQLV